MMYTENKDIASEFTKLPYEKKVCFVPFESKEKSLVQVEFRNKGSMRSLEFRKIVTGMAMGRYPYYSVLDLIEKAEILPIVSVCK